MNSQIVLTSQIRNVNREDANKALLQVIITTYRICGFKSSEDEVMFQVTELMKDLNKTSLSIEDVKTAFENGAKGKYGEFMGLSVLTYLKWINAHKAEKPAPTNKLIAESKIELTQEQKDAIAEESIKVMIDHYQKKGEIINGGNANFKYLWRIGKIRFDQQKAEEYLERAKSLIYERLNQNREKASVELNRGEVKQIDKQIEALMDSDVNTEIKIEAGKLAIKDFLNSK